MDTTRSPFVDQRDPLYDDQRDRGDETREDIDLELLEQEQEWKAALARILASQEGER